jgi:hypothetical protein
MIIDGELVVGRIKFKSPIYEFIDFEKPTKTKGFKDLKSGDHIQFIVSLFQYNHYSQDVITICLNRNMEPWVCTQGNFYANFNKLILREFCDVYK